MSNEFLLASNMTKDAFPLAARWRCFFLAPCRGIPYHVLRFTLELSNFGMSTVALRHWKVIDL